MSVSPSRLRDRQEISDTYRWSLDDIFQAWDDWQVALDEIQSKVRRYAALKGTLGEGAGSLLAAYRLADEIGQALYRVWYYAALGYDQDQRDNSLNARRQQVQSVLAEWAQASAWFSPELLRIPLATVHAWMDELPDLVLYRFAIEDLYRQQEHVLDDAGEHLMSLATRFDATPSDSYAALSTADARHPTITLSDGESLTLTYGTYRSILATRRQQSDRRLAFETFHEAYKASENTYASMYNAVLQRDWFHAQARGYRTTLEAALHGHNVPQSVVETLIETGRQGTGPLRRYHALRRRVLGLESYHLYDAMIPLVDHDRAYPYDQTIGWVIESAAPLGQEYLDTLRGAFASRWIDVYETPGKRSGAYSAPVYGVHPYVLLNHNETLDAVFTVAHEMGHSMHTVLAHQHQPFIYAGYAIFVAEVPSTLSEALFLEYLLARTDDPRERIVLLQHAIDDVMGTFYTQVMFADFELRAHRLVETGQPITAEVLSSLYGDLLRDYHGESVDHDDLARVTWARIPHFYGTPYYVYQYATCYASTALLMRQITEGPDDDRRAAVGRYLDLLKSGGSDHPMALLQRAGVDLNRTETIRAVVEMMDRRVGLLEASLNELPA